jgi:hypothetical protein
MKRDGAAGIVAIPAGIIMEIPTEFASVRNSRAFSDQTENALALLWRATLSDQLESSSQPDRPAELTHSECHASPHPVTQRRRN